MYLKKIMGDRIYLSPRDSSEDEINKYVQWVNDFKVTDYIGNSDLNTSLSSEKNFLENSANNSNEKCFSIVDSDTNNLIGPVGLEDLNYTKRSATLGIFIGDENYRSNGYGTEAINLILDYGFNYLNLHSIKLSLLSVNERAHKCYLKCGFKDTGMSRDAFFINGKYYDELYMDILENEFNGDFIKNKEVK